jgi:foldase protein PrsA
MIVPVVVALVVCRDQDHSPTVARVGKAALTLDDLNKSIPPEYSDRISRSQMLEYVKQWVDTELLYQEAMRQKLHKEPIIRERLEKMKKDLLGAEMISRSSFGSSDYQIADDRVRAYYEEHKESFRRESDVVRYIEIVVGDVQTAWQVRNKMARDNFLDLAVRFSEAPVQDPRTVPFVAIHDLPPEIADVVAKLRVNGTTSPIKLADGYHILRLLDKQDAGTYHELSEVRDEIVNTLATAAQKRGLERLLSDLRLKTDYELNLELIPRGAADSADDLDSVTLEEEPLES